MQMSFIIIGGYVVASSPPVARLIDRLARDAEDRPRRGLLRRRWSACSLRLLHWGLSSIFGSCWYARSARRDDLRIDYRAVGAAAYLGLGAVWALGLSSSAAQLQANPASMPPALLAITGVIPFAQTIFLWQSIALTRVLIVVSLRDRVADRAARREGAHAREHGHRADAVTPRVAARSTRPGEWLEHSPLLDIITDRRARLRLARAASSQRKGPSAAISNLNTYNFLFLMLGLLLHWRPRVIPRRRTPRCAERRPAC